MRGHLLLAGVFIASMASVTHAADVAKPVATTPAAVVPAVTWAGFYAGLNAGYAWGTSTFAFVPPSLNTGTVQQNPTGFLGGAQAGFDHQLGHLVLGIGASIEGGNVTGAAACPTFKGTSCRSSFDFIATVTGRAGVALGTSSLLYGKGGFAAGDYAFNATGLTTAQYNQWATGWTAGGGIEHRIHPGMTMFVEYDYFALSSPDGVAPAGNHSTDRSKISAVLVGFNLR